MKDMVKKAQSGDKDALVELVLAKKDQYYRMAWSYLQDEHRVRDALQETIIKAFHDIVQLKHLEYFHTWYARILINTCKQYIKHESKVINIDEIRESAESAPSGYEDQIDLEYGMNQLPQEYREVIFMRYMEDLPVKDIADMLNLPAGTVKSRIHYGISKLRQYVGERKVGKYEVQ